MDNPDSVTGGGVSPVHMTIEQQALALVNEDKTCPFTDRPAWECCNTCTCQHGVAAMDALAKHGLAIRKEAVS